VAKDSALQKEIEPDHQPVDHRAGVLGIVRNLSQKTNADSLDHLIHERIRLGIVSALAVNDTMTFSDLKKLLNTTDGNLSVHARKLEDASYVSCTKSFEGRIPRTKYKLTENGRRVLERYLDHMDALIQSMRAR
jgi:DNA-binding MarR family transcriptional regulator